MAYNSKFIVLAVICVLIPRVILATEYKVGDDSGWTIKFDYAAWAKDKDFRVGDKLVFSYPASAHNVFKVNATAFKDCIKPPETEALSTGNDVITLATPGNKWYFCGVGQHCTVGGQKLSITVLPVLQEKLEGPSAAPVSSNSARGIVKSGYQVFIAALFVFAMMS